MKKIISLTLALVLIIGTLCVFPVGASEIEESNPDPFLTSGDWKYLLDDNGNAVIRGYVGDEDDVKIPGELDGHKVTEVFSLGVPGKSINYEHPVVTLRIGRNIKKINSLGMYNLSKYIVSAENKYYTAKKGILYNKTMTKLISYPRNHVSREFKIEKTVTYLGEDSVSNNLNLTKVVIPSAVTKISSGAFACSRIETLIITKGVKKIGNVAFWKCTRLNKVTFKNTKAISVGSRVFADCKSLRMITLPLMTKKSGDSMFESAGLTKITIRKNIKTIPGGCFFDCKKLRSITIPSTIKSIGKQALGYKWGDYVIERDKDFVIKCKKGSAAYKYAKKNRIKFKAI